MSTGGDEDDDDEIVAQEYEDLMHGANGLSNAPRPLAAKPPLMCNSARRRNYSRARPRPAVHLASPHSSQHPAIAVAAPPPLTPRVPDTTRTPCVERLALLPACEA